MQDFVVIYVIFVHLYLSSFVFQANAMKIEDIEEVC